MFVGISNTPQPYDWGSTTAMAQVLGRDPSGRPEAELWLGSHPASPSIVGPDETLLDWLSHHGRPPLPFLLKVLAAAAPLSLQAHPSAQRAQAGYEREQSLGIPLGSGERSYRDPFAKPELLVALSDRFHALCGFRPAAAVDAALTGIARWIPDAGILAPLQMRLRSGIQDAFGWVAHGGPEVDLLVGAVSDAAAALPALRTQALLSAAHPGDPGIVLSLLLHEIELGAGDAVFLAPGTIHAYLAGTGIELMGASDNVLRGGLTHKKVDVPELISILDFSTGPAPVLAGHRVGDAMSWRPDGAPFALTRVDGVAQVALRGEAIALATASAAELTGAAGTVPLPRGAAVLVSGESRLGVRGSGVFVATGA